MCSYPDLVAGVDYTDVAGTLTVTLPTLCVLCSGHFWVSPVPRMDFSQGGEWGWGGRTDAAYNLSKWQNPGGGWGTGCNTWGDTTDCLGGDPDFTFSITGAICSTATGNDAPQASIAGCVPVELQGFSVE